MPDKAAHDDAPQQLLIGDRLREAREAAAIPVEKIASDLLLDPGVLVHLEAEEFAELGAPVFVRGHLRKYALRLGLPADELVELYHRDHDRPQGLPIVNESLAFTQKKHRGWMLVLLLAIAVAAIAIFLLKDKSGEPAVESAAAPAPGEDIVLETTPVVAGSLIASVDPEKRLPKPPAVVESKPEPEPEPEPELAQPQPQPQPQSVATAPAASAPSSPPVASSPAVASPVDAVLLDVAFAFSQDSWIEVYDATGARLLYAMGRAGSIRNVSGEPPLRVFLGLAGAVEVRVGGEDFTIPPQRIRGNVARFVIDGRGAAGALAGQTT